ncbi:MAG: DMT family transporter [Bacteroidetes bacterium]|nr:DMT family transporter [Bacteroidota bacterium]
MDHRKGITYALVTASFWGFMAIVLKFITYELPPVIVVWFRFFFAFLVLGTWTLIFRRSDFRIFKKPPWLLILAALFLAVNYTGFIAGIKYVTPSSSQIFIQIGPVSFALAGILIFKEHVNWKHIVGFIFVLVGMGLFYSEQLKDLGAEAENLTLGMLLVLGGGLSWAAFTTSQKVLLKRISPNQVNLFVYAACSLGLLPLVAFSELSGMPAVNWIILIYLGLNTVIAYGSLGLAIKYTEAARVSVIITLNPIITFITMAILSRMEVSWMEPETFSLMGLLGAMSVIGGAIIVISAGLKKKEGSR